MKLPGMVDIRTMPERCPVCGAIHDGRMSPPDALAGPVDGDCAICADCLEPSVYEGGRRRLPTPHERAEILAKPEVVEHRMAIFTARHRPGRVMFPCGCVMEASIEDGAKVLLYRACSDTCGTFADFVDEARRSGKPIEFRG